MVRRGRGRPLGPTEAQADDGAPVPLGPPKQRALLAALMLRAGRPVRVTELVDTLWPTDPPRSAVKNLQLYIHQLRKLLGGGLPHHHGSYQLDPCRYRLDAAEFERLLAAARRMAASDPEQARQAYRSALDLWRGPALTLRPAPVRVRPQRVRPKEINMTATYTFDVFSSLDGFGAASGDWTGYWGKQGPELLDHRLALYEQEQRMVFGAHTYRLFGQLVAQSDADSEVRDPWVTRMLNLPATVVSTSMEASLDAPNVTVVSGDAVDVVARLKTESEVPLRSHGSLSMNRSLLKAGLVDRIQVTLFPVVTGRSGRDPIFQGAEDFDLELIEHRTLDGRTQELICRPALHP
ncbi:dihydrofolate reductase family protein [Plantactinospora sp. GCM10030261]|uniref:dihydrofolate reductase family protein n=1 Tax=Plantactinospora sp. GCM10030261 TaxID=3273420 RepID=UPI003619650A